MSKPNNLESLWMPFTPNKTFKKDPRIIVKAKDMHFTSDDNRQILDGTAGLWCVNAGHDQHSHTINRRYHQGFDGYHHW